jgi:hypothetical protein
MEHAADDGDGALNSIIKSQTFQNAGRVFFDARDSSGRQLRPEKCGKYPFRLPDVNV